MALLTSFIVVPFLKGARGALHPGTPRRLRARASAVVIADSLARFYAGVAILRDRSDPAAGIFLEPLLILTLGEVPAEFLAQLAA